MREIGMAIVEGGAMGIVVGLYVAKTLKSDHHEADLVVKGAIVLGTGLLGAIFWGSVRMVYDEKDFREMLAHCRVVLGLAPRVI